MKENQLNINKVTSSNATASNEMKIAKISFDVITPPIQIVDDVLNVVNILEDANENDQNLVQIHKVNELNENRIIETRENETLIAEINLDDVPTVL